MSSPRCCLPCWGGQDGTAARHHAGPTFQRPDGSGCCSQQSVRDQESGPGSVEDAPKAGALQPQVCLRRPESHFRLKTWKKVCS